MPVNGPHAREAVRVTRQMFGVRVAPVSPVLPRLKPARSYYASVVVLRTRRRQALRMN